MADDEEGIALGRHYDEATQRVGRQDRLCGRAPCAFVRPERNRQGDALSDSQSPIDQGSFDNRHRSEGRAGQPSPPIIAARSATW